MAGVMSIARGKGFIRRLVACVFALLVLLIARPAASFSVLAHQGLVDAAWEPSIVPALQHRFPNVSQEQLEKARAFAYGGSHIADLGYFPFGNRLFTDLVHYVRSGDFVSALVAEAQTPEQLAFALGALAHWEADTIGHAEATNVAVPEVYPELREEFGNRVTYADDHDAHLQTEFRFDILQLARTKQSPDLFRHAIAFEVDTDLLDRAFRKTYGIGLDDLFTSKEVAITTYRWGFRALIQEATGIAWQLYEDDIEKIDPDATEKSFVFEMPREDFEKEFGKSFEEAGYFAKFFAVFTNVIPDWGPFERLPFKPLPRNVQDQFGAAFDHAVASFRGRVDGLRAEKPLELENVSLDTGEPTRGGEYEPADEAHTELLEELDEHDFAGVPPELKTGMVRFFRERDERPPPDLDEDDVQEQREALARLEAAQPEDTQPPAAEDTEKRAERSRSDRHAGS